MYSAPSLARSDADDHDRREARCRHGLVLIAVTEMVAAKSGLGYLIWNAWETFSVGQMYVVGECPNQSFIPLINETIEAHRRGEDRIRHNGQGDFVSGSIR